MFSGAIIVPQISTQWARQVCGDAKRRLILYGELK
jgi:hypothetical protein